MYILKLALFFVFVLGCSTLFGQGLDMLEGECSFANGVEFKQWHIDEFRKNNFKKVKAYIFKFKDNVQRQDSVLLYQQEVNFDSSIVVGIKLIGDQYENPLWDKSKTYFNQNGRIVKHIESPLYLETKLNNGKEELYNPVREDIFEYDQSNRLLKEVYNDYSYNISNNGQDTLIMLHPEINEYIYNDAGQKIKMYCTDDSTRYLRTSIQHYTSWCSYCKPRYLNMEWYYNSKDLLERVINYTPKGEFHTKKYFYYDNHGKVVEEIDSTGWPWTNDKSGFISRYKTFTYLDSTKVITEFRGPKNQGSYQVCIYRLDGKELSDCWYYEDTIMCSEYLYKFDNNKLVHVLFNSNRDYKEETFYLYNIAGKLYEKKVMFDGKLRTMIKYYYE